MKTDAALCITYMIEIVLVILAGKNLSSYVHCLNSVFI